MSLNITRWCRRFEFFRDLPLLPVILDRFRIDFKQVLFSDSIDGGGARVIVLEVVLIR